MRSLALLLAPGCLLTGCGSDAVAEGPTWAAGVGALVHTKCAPCHHPGEAAPFSLLTHADVARRARQIGLVVGSGTMPPWPPDSSVRALRDDRSLSEGELALFEEWLSAGAPEGDPSLAPEPPSYADDWVLGTPELVARFEAPYELQSEGRDVYRNFVIPRPVASGQRWVRAVEWRFSTRTPVHHAVLFVDKSGGAAQLASRETEPGFGGMGPGPARVPDGQFVGWAPGKQPRFPDLDIAWSLDDSSDLVVQLHMRPTGKPERIDLELGLHLDSGPPTAHPVAIRLIDTLIDIPAGASDHRVSDEYELPVDLEVLELYPHAHYLGKELAAHAILPDGERVDLFRIPHWDFDWQDEYAFLEPLPLPRGTRIVMEYTFDNSAANPSNPHQPPRRVVYGEQSDDEMAELLLSVLPAPEDLPILYRDFAWKVHADAVARFEALARAAPEIPSYQAQLARLALEAGDYAAAEARYERLVALRPGAPGPLASLGHVRFLAGDAEGAREALEAALVLDGEHIAARTELARVRIRLGELDRAAGELRELAASYPGYVAVRHGLAELARARGDVAEEARAYEALLSIDPEDTVALCALGELELARDTAAGTAAAHARARAALAVYPDEARAQHLLGLVLEANGDLQGALEALETAQRLARPGEDYGVSLARVRAKLLAASGGR